MSFKRKVSETPQKQSKMSAWIWLTGGGVAAVLLVVGLFYLGYRGQAIANSGIAGLNILPDTDRHHQDGDITFTEDAPAGGIHDEPVRVETFFIP